MLYHGKVSVISTGDSIAGSVNASVACIMPIFIMEGNTRF